MSGPGTSSDQPSQSPGQDRRPAAQPSVDRKIRVTNLYATPWQLPERTAAGELSDYLELWRFEQYYRLSADQLPRVLHREVLDAAGLGFSRWASRAGQAAAALVWLFQLPSGQIIAALSIDVRGELAHTIDLLEDCYFGDVQIGGTPAEAYVHALAARLGVDGGAARFLPERHQIVFDEAPAPDDCEDLIQRLIYRADRPYRKEFSAICYPPELNRRPGWLAAVGPYVSVVCGQAGFIENAIFLSAVQAVGAAAQLRAIRHAAYTDVRLFRDLEAAGASTRDRRRMLERISDQLGDLELELSYSVEASADLGLLVPSLRAENFHNALYESMGLAGKAVTVGRMLARLSAAISAELTAIGSIERRADENRRVRYAVAVGFISVVAIPASLILTYLGINASQVSPARSMFSSHYLGMYLTVAAVIVIGGVLSLVLWIQQRRDARHHRVRGERQRWALVTDEPSQ